MLDKNLAANQKDIVFENGRNALAKVGPGGISWGHQLISNNIRYQISKKWLIGSKFEKFFAFFEKIFW